MRALLIALFTLIASPAMAETLELVGRAFAENADTPLYVERHQQQFSGDRLTLHTVVYESTSGETIARKTATYPKQPGVAEYEFNDLRSGARDGAKYLPNGKLELFARKTGSDELKTGSIEVRANTVVDAGFDRYVAANFDTLLAGEAVKIRFGIPGRQKAYKFLVNKPVRTEFLGREALQVKIRPASTLLSWLVDPITLTYDIASRRLLQYDGVSNIKTDGGELQTVRVIYYPEENPRLFSPDAPR